MWCHKLVAMSCIRRSAWVAFLAVLAPAVSLTHNAMADPIITQSDTHIIPVLTITERYDSNVFFIQGKNLEDYVTTVNPQLRVDHTGRLVSGTLTGSVTGEAYVKNPGLDYIAPSVSTSLNLDNLVGQLDHRAKLKVSDAFTYTPRPLAFLGPEGASVVPDAFVRGIQATRANSLTNQASANAGYALTSATMLQATYMHSHIQFGKQFATPNFGTFFSTTFQNLSAGPQYKASPLDVLSLNYQYSRADFGLTNGAKSGFETQGGTLGWQRQLTPTVSANAAGGVTIFSGGNIQYLVDASVNWKYENGEALVRYSRLVFPSFFVAALPLVSQVVTASATYALTGNLSATVTGNYARNESVPTPILLFSSYGTSLSMNYKISRAISAIATYTHNNFLQEFRGQQAEFSRNLVSLSVRGEWN